MNKNKLMVKRTPDKTVSFLFKFNFKIFFYLGTYGKLSMNNIANINVSIRFLEKSTG